jgi:hypothetical protein
MKIKLSIVCVSLLLVMFVSGCLSGRPQVTSVPQVTTTPVFNPVTGITNYTFQTNFVLQTNTVWTVNTNAINSAAGLAQTGVALGAGLNPAVGPLGNLAVAWGTGGAFLLSTILAAYRNQQNKNILAAVVQGVEGAAPTGQGDNFPVTLATVKASIQNAATAAGVQPALHSVVMANT